VSVTSNIRRRGWRSAAIAAALLAAAVLAPSLASATTGAATVQGPKPTIVLVHGAWADSSSWSGVIRRLQNDGYVVDAPPNPLRGLPYDASYLANFLTTISGPMVLVGHSYGGAVITNAATGNPNVKALVFVDAFAPAAGESISQLAAAQPGSVLAGNPATVFNFVPYPGGPPGDVDLYLKPDVFARSFAGDLPAKQSAMLAAEQRPLAASAAAEPSGSPAWTAIPSWYVVGTADRVLPAAEQEFMATRAHSHVTRVDASHLAMVSHPDLVEDVIRDAAHATS
jgi:pimeloyl-ACP methyl ester carboxylesterase